MVVEPRLLECPRDSASDHFPSKIRSISATLMLPEALAREFPSPTARTVCSPNPGEAAAGGGG